jgi:hypothetical protein
MYMAFSMSTGIGDLDHLKVDQLCFNMFGGEINWMSKQQVVISLSTTEVEYMEATHGRKKEVWLQRLCSGIGFEKRAMKISCDSQSTIFLAKNPSYHSKTKDIDVHYHFGRDMMERNKAR